MPRARDETKVCADLAPDLFVKFEARRRASGLSRAAALRQVIERNLGEVRSDVNAQQPDVVPGTSDASRHRVRVVPVPVRARDIARSPSANTVAIASAIAASVPVQDDPKAREEMEHEKFLQSPVTRALLSRWQCSRCGIPVDKKWTHCPVCGNEEMKARDMGDYEGLDEALTRWRNVSDIAEH